MHYAGSVPTALGVVKGSDMRWRTQPDKLDWKSVPSSEHSLIVKQRSGVFDQDAEEGGGKTKGDGKGKGQEGQGKGGEKGGGKGDGSGKGGEKKEGKPGGGGTKGEGTGSSADDAKVLADFQKKLGDVGSPTTVPPDTRVAAALKELTYAERDDLARYLREAQKKAAEEGKPFDPVEVIEYYKNLSPSDRELLRTNLELAKSTDGRHRAAREGEDRARCRRRGSTAQWRDATKQLNDELANSSASWRVSTRWSPTRRSARRISSRST